MVPAPHTRGCRSSGKQFVALDLHETFIDAAQQYLDAATSSSFHKHTVIRRCECGPDITVQGEAIAVVFQHLAK